MNGNKFFNRANYVIFGQTSILALYWMDKSNMTLCFLALAIATVNLILALSGDE